MAPHTTDIAPDTQFTLAEQQSLQALRARYGADQDLFTRTERAHLEFLRWLVRTGRLDPQA